MLNRRLASLVAAVSVAGLVATGCGSQSAAVRVGDESVSRSDFEEQLDVVYESDEFQSFLLRGMPKEQMRSEGDPPGAYTQEYVAAMADVHINYLLVGQALENEGLEVTDEDRTAVESELGSILPDELRSTYVEWFAGFEKLQAELSESEFNEVVGEVLTTADINVSSRYGSWDPDQFRVTPPPGPAAAPDAAADADFGVGAG